MKVAKKFPNPSPQAAEEVDRQFETDFDPDEELEPGIPLRQTGQAARSIDPELRADDESPQERNRVLRQQGD